MITKFGSINFDNINLTLPSKQNKKYISELSCLGKPLVIQTPKFNISSINSSHLTLSQPDIVSFFASLENLLKSTCHEKSYEWFNGKSFSFDFIQQAFKSLVCDDSIQLPLSKDLSVYNHLKEKCEFPSSIESYSATAIIHIDSLWISHHHIGYTLSVSQLKFSKLPINFSQYIIDSDDSDTPPSDIDSEIAFDETKHAFFDDLLDY